MGLFDQSPFEMITGKKSPIEGSIPANFSEYLGGTMSILPLGGISSSLSTVGNTGKAVLAGGALLGGGALAGWLFGGGGSKKDQTITQQPGQVTNSNVYHAPYEVYQPVTTTNITDARSWMTIANSPGSSMTKKDSVSTPTNAAPIFTTPQNYTVNPTQATQAGQTATDNTDMIKIAAIGAIVLIAAAYIGRKK